MSSAEALTAKEREILLDLARSSIRHGVCHKTPCPVDLGRLPESFKSPCATFVTLEREGHLRGCMGTLEAKRALAEDIAHNAFAAAFHDPRFVAIDFSEVEALFIQLSLLSAPEIMHFDSEEALIAQLRPHVDGLIMEKGGLTGTFLPSVWEALPGPRDFLQQLKLKAGLPKGYWAKSIKIYRYTTQTIGSHFP